MKFGKTPVPKDVSFPTEDTAKGLIRFSFKYLDLSHELFSVNNSPDTYLPTLLGRLKGVSTWKMLELRQTNSKSMRAHPIDWSDRRVALNGFDIPQRKDLDEQAYQFNVTKAKHGRVLGFIIGDTFFIRWFDRQHNCYDS